MANPLALGTEVRALARLATPVVIAEIGWMSMGLVDTIMVGRLGPEAIAATGLGSSLFTAVAIFGMGLLLGLDTLVSQAFGAGRIEECRRLLYQGLWLAVLISPAVLVFSALGYSTMGSWGLNADIEALAKPYFEFISLSALPLLVYAALRRYLQGIHVVGPIMLALVSANLINAAANYVLIYGHAGFPALGVRGSALATVAARCYMVAFLAVAVRLTHREQPRVSSLVSRRLDIVRLRQLLRLGLPAATQITLEVGAFTVATALAAKLDAVSSASHQIALNIASLTYMVPLGLCSAVAVRVGHAVGARDRSRAIEAGWLAIALGCLLTALMALVMLLAPTPILRLFTPDPKVIATGTTLLAIAAAFQLFDGVQTVAIGALRGFGDTVAPMIINLVAHWVLGLPIGYILCFYFGWGVTGIWIGFSTGLIVAAFVLLTVWVRRTRLATMLPLAPEHSGHTR